MFDEGFENLEQELSQYLSNSENVQEILEVGASEFVKDLLKLAKPKSAIRKTGYTHLIDSFTYQKIKNNEIEVGWGKTYGRIVENRTPHLRPLWEKNKNKYYNLMVQKFEP